MMKELKHAVNHRVRIRREQPSQGEGMGLLDPATRREGQQKMKRVSPKLQRNRRRGTGTICNWGSQDPGERRKGGISVRLSNIGMGAPGHGESSSSEMKTKLKV